jgi:bifunctional non-homologous end joining protein LigD
VRLITKGGYDWTRRYPAIVEAALRNRQSQFVIDGEAVVRGADGIPDFSALHSGRYDEHVELYAFDVLAIGGEDLRGLPLSMRKTNLQRLLARRPESIFLADFEQGEIGRDLFRKVCEFGLRAVLTPFIRG